jgi:hypothetical protein
MIRRSAYIGLAAMALAAGACTDVRSSQPATDVEREAARSLLRQISALSVQPESSSEILAAMSAAPILVLIAPEGTPMPTPATSDRDIAAMREDCLIATNTSVTFSQCEIGSHAVEGTWSAEDHRIHAELVDVFVIDPEQHGSVAFEANLSSSAELSGVLDADFMWSTNDDDFYLFDASLRIDSLLLDTPDCASGGTITITGALGDGPRMTTSLWFGPGCSDVQIAR